MTEIEIIPKNQTVLYLPKTPAKWVGEPKYTKIVRILMTCGGGMGGAQWYEYVYRNSEKFVEFGNEQFMEFTRIDGKSVTLNPRYIVTTENFTLVTAIYDSQNPNFRKGKWTVEYLVEDGQKVTPVNKFS